MFGALEKLEFSLACHARDHQFESGTPRHSGDVVQLGEHLICTQAVAGSMPVISTIFCADLAQLVEHRFCKPTVVGSIPIVSSIFKVTHDY